MRLASIEASGLGLRQANRMPVDLEGHYKGLCLVAKRGTAKRGELVLWQEQSWYWSWSWA
jgi:hypothetical protein